MKAIAQANEITPPVCDINCRLCDEAIRQIHEITEAYIKEHQMDIEKHGKRASA